MHILFRHNQSANVVVQKILYKSNFPSGHYGSILSSFRVAKHDIPKDGSQHFHIGTIISGMLEQFLQEHTYV